MKIQSILGWKEVEKCCVKNREMSLMIFDEFDGAYASDEIKQKTLRDVMKQKSREKRADMTVALILYVTRLLVVPPQP